MKRFRIFFCLSTSFLLGLVCAISLGDLSQGRSGPEMRTPNQRVHGNDYTPSGGVVDQQRPARPSI